MKSLCVLIFFLFPKGSSAEISPTVPNRISSQDHGRQIWISKSLAIAADGSLNPELGSRAAQFSRMFPRQRGDRKNDSVGDGTATDDCGKTWGELQGDWESINAPFLDTRNSLFEGAFAIYRGIVVATAPGFGWGEPGTLARVRVTETIKPSPAIDTRDGLLVFHDYARFAGGSFSFCVGHRPLRNGDQVLLFVRHQPSNDDGGIVGASDGLFIEHAGKVLAPPDLVRKMRVGPDTTLNEIRLRAAERLNRD